MYLTGFMGAGKSAVGRALAERLDWRIRGYGRHASKAQEGITIAEIFSQPWESAWFRRLESADLAITRGLDRHGCRHGRWSAVRSGEPRVAEGPMGSQVWLDVSFEIVVGRLGASRIRRRVPSSRASHRLVSYSPGGGVNMVTRTCGSRYCLRTRRRQVAAMNSREP